MNVTRSFALSSVLSIAVLGVTPQPAAPPDPSSQARIAADVADYVHAEHIEGATIAIVSGANVHYRAFGLSDVGSGSRANAETRYETGSVTKQFTAAAILQLSEAAKLNLDAPLATYLPSAPHAKDITIRQLLTQTSGLTDYTKRSNFAAVAGTPTTFDAVMTSIANKPLDFTPGTAFEFSSTNYLLLGRVIEVVSGEPWPRYAKTRLFDPAGMTQTSTVASEAQLSNMARGYAYAHGHAEPAPPIDESWVSSAGDLVTTAGDLVKWHDALSAGLIISPADLQLMTTTPRLADGSKSPYGFGVYVSTFESQPIVLSQGDTFGFDASDVFFPNQGVRIIVLTNTEIASVDSSIELAERAYNELFPEIAKNQPSQIATSAPSAEALYTAALQKMLRLPEPAYATYNVSVDAPGQHLSLIRVRNGPFLDLGGKGGSHLDSNAIFRKSDGAAAVKLDDGSYAASYYASWFGATWSAVHDWMRFGGEGAVPDDSAKQTRTDPDALRTIAVVSSLNPGSYRVFDQGAALCPGGERGHLMHLIALTDPDRHPLTDATIDDRTGLFCMMRITITRKHLRCLHLCTAVAELHFGTAGDYSVITDARLTITYRAAGIDVQNTTMAFGYSDFAFPATVDPALFDVITTE